MSLLLTLMTCDFREVRLLAYLALWHRSGDLRVRVLKRVIMLRRPAVLRRKKSLAYPL